jgi:replicative DNA helicase
MRNIDVSQIVYTPAEIGALSTDARRERLEAAKRGYGLPFPIDYVAADLNPIAPGDLCTITGRPGNGKTHNMKWWARERAFQLAGMGETNRIVIYVTYEQHIEDLNMFDLAAMTGISITTMARNECTPAELKMLDDADVERHKLPLWSIGHSSQRRGKRPKMTVDVLEDALHKIQTWDGDEGFLIDSIFIDYLQRIPYTGESKNVGISNNLDQIKDMGLATVSPVVLGVQAKQAVDNYDTQIPGISDGQWTDNIRQTSDVNIALARPAVYCKDGDIFYKTVVDGFTQMLMVIWKQKLGVANKYHWITCDPRYNTITGAKTTTTDFKNY